jgi:hypothetical protein
LLVQSWFAAHPASEVVALILTAARAQSQAASLLSAMNAVTAAEAETRRLIAVWDGASRWMRKRLRALAQELNLLLDPMDSRWLAFGFNRPGQMRTPEAPAEVTAVSDVPAK